MDYQKIEKDFKQLEKHTNSLVNQYNKSVDSIKSQELAIEKVKQQLDSAVLKSEELNAAYKSGKDNPKLFDAMDKQELIIKNLTNRLNIMNSKLSETKAKANELKIGINDALDKKHAIKFGDGINDIGKKIDKFKNKMTRLLGTAMIFSLLRSQLTGLRNGFLSLLKENDAFSNSLNSIKANLMTSFAPIYNACLPAINSLMNALSKLTGTIAVFVSGLFGKSLKDAQKDAKGLSKALNKTAKSGKEASGSLASIDKLEVINDNSSAGTSSSGNDIDYSGEIQYSQKLLDFLNLIKDFVSNNKELITGFLFGIAGGILAIKLGLGGILSLGIGLILAGIITLVQGIINFIKDPSWENFTTILQGLALVLAGVAVAMIAVNAANPVAWIMLAIAAVIALVSVIIKNWDKIKETLGAVGGWIYDHIIKPIGDLFSQLWSGIKQGANDAWNGVKSVFSTVATFFKNIFTNAWNNVKKVFSTGGKIFDGIKEGILNGFKAVVNAIIRGINKVVSIPFNGINTVLKKVRDISILGAQPFKNVIKTINVPQIPLLAKGAVIPPRQKFAAILGDQKHGTNIEAPLDTIKQANREVLSEFFDKMGDFNSQEREIVLKNLTFILQMGNTDFRKFIFNELKLYEKDIGKPILVN